MSETLTIPFRPAAERRVRKALGNRTRKFLMGGLALLVAVILWQIASASHARFIVSFENVPTPAKVAAVLWAQLASAEFYRHVVASIRRIAIGFGIAAVLGIGIGLSIGRFRAVSYILTPFIEILRPIPAVAWVPLAILMWPTEESSIIFITAIGALFPIVLNTAHGVQQTPEVLLRAAQSLGAREASLFRHVILPSALPHICTGLVVGMGVAWFSLLAGEMISGQYGIGYFTWLAYTLVQYPKIIVGMLAIGLLGSGSSLIVRQALQPLLRWQAKGIAR